MSPDSDRLTIAAIAIAAMCIVTTDHELIGHGVACLAQDGHVNLVTSVYFDCSVKTGIVAAGGPFGDLTGAALAWMLLQAAPLGIPRLRLLLLLITAFGVFWEAGYLLKAMIAADGDSYFAARDAFSAPESWWRIGGCVLGLLLYLLGMRATRAAAQPYPPNTLAIAWIVASVAAIGAAALYAPNRFDALFQAALEIGAASLPLLWLDWRRSKAAATRQSFMVM